MSGLRAVTATITPPAAHLRCRAFARRGVGSATRVLWLRDAED